MAHNTACSARRSKLWLSATCNLDSTAHDSRALLCLLDVDISSQRNKHYFPAYFKLAGRPEALKGGCACGHGMAPEAMPNLSCRFPK